MPIIKWPVKICYKLKGIKNREVDSDIKEVPRASLVAQLVKNLPTMRETWVRSLGWEDPLEKGKATHSSILAWRIHALHTPSGLKESDTAE